MHFAPASSGTMAIQKRRRRQLRAALVVRLYFNDLNPDRRAKVEAHLAVCPACQAHYETLVNAFGPPPRG
jgi:hypothetical protein